MGNARLPGVKGARLPSSPLPWSISPSVSTRFAQAAQFIMKQDNLNSSGVSGAELLTLSEFSAMIEYLCQMTKLQLF